jgi:hypothetical protein
MSSAEKKMQTRHEACNYARMIMERKFKKRPQFISGIHENPACGVISSTQYFSWRNWTFSLSFSFDFFVNKKRKMKNYDLDIGLER